MEGQRERERESEADFILSAEPNVGLDLMTLRSPPEWKPRVGCLTNCATQVPQGYFLQCGSMENKLEEGVCLLKIIFNESKKIVIQR